jgi:hypothetical protein
MPSTATAQRLTELVGAYSRRVYPAVLAQQEEDSVSSPLGIWLLLAACLTGAAGAEREDLEGAVGCSPAEAGELLAGFLREPPPALHAAIAVWTAAAQGTDALAAWLKGLPPEVESGEVPTQQQADEWADRHTLGLIKRFPVDLALARIVLSSALATRVSWRAPFELVAAGEHLAQSSPWRGRVLRVLWDNSPAGGTGLVQTSAAGLVAVHQAVAREGITVVSVAAEPGVERAAVLEAAHEVAAGAADRCSLFAVPLGDGHSWTVTEREVPATRECERIEHVAGASLPAWRTEGRLDLERSAAFAARPALETMRKQIGPQPDDLTKATQVALASFTRYGFEAAAVTTFAVTRSAMPALTGTAIARTAVLRFDHPYAALAVSDSGLPLFAAWIATPAEAEKGVERA